MTLRLFSIALLFAVQSFVWTPLNFASDWAHWSGPNGNMTAVDGAFDQEAFALEVAWTKDLGSAYSRIAVSEGRVITAFSNGEYDFFIALAAADGSELWRYQIAETYLGHDGSDDGPLSSPTIDGDTVYGLGPFGHLFALRLTDGTPIWERKLGEDLARKPEYGFTTAPLVIGDALVVQTGGEKSAVTSFDRATGEPRWSALEGKVTYESPSLLNLGGREQIVAATDKEISGLDPKDGSVLWTHVYSKGEVEGIAHPLPIGDDRLLFTTWTEAILLDLSGEAPVEVWRTRDLARTYALPVLHEGHLYGYSAAFLTAVDLETGAKTWKSRPPGGGNLVLVDGHLVIQVQKGGELVVVEANSEEYREKARVQSLEKGYYTGPTFAEGMVFVRNLKQIAAVRVVDSADDSPSSENSPEINPGLLPETPLPETPLPKEAGHKADQAAEDAAPND